MRYLIAILVALFGITSALASDSITNKASGSAFTMDFALDSVTGNIRQMTALFDPTTGLLVSPFQNGNNIGNTAFIANAGTNLNTSLLALESGGNLATLAASITASVQQSNEKQINGVVPLMGNGVTGPGSQRVTIASDNTPFSVNLGTLGGAATAANQTNATQKTQIVDGSGNVIASTANNLNIQCANCSGSGVSTADEASFVGGTSLFAGMGGFFQTTPTSNPLMPGQQGMGQMTANRALFVNPRNAAGTEIATAAAPFRIDPTGTTTQPISGTVTANAGTNLNTSLLALETGGNLATLAGSITASVQQHNVKQINGVAPLMGNGVTGTGSQRVTIASDNTAFTVNLGTIGSAATAANQNTAAAQGSTTAGQTMSLEAGAVTTSAPSYTTGQTSPLSLDPSGNLRVNVTTGGVSGNVSQGSTTSGNTGPMAQGAVTTAAPTYTTGQTDPLSLTPAGALRVDASGTAIAGAAPGAAVASGNTISVQNPSLDACQTQTHSFTPINIGTATTVQIATPTAAKKNYLCHLFLYAGGADNVAVIEGANATCTTGTVAGVMGGATTATGFIFPAGQGFESGNGSYAIASNGTVNQSICIVTSAAVQLSGVAAWATQ